MKRAIVEKFIVLPAGGSIGFDRENDRLLRAVHHDGIAVIAQAVRDLRDWCSR